MADVAMPAGRSRTSYLEGRQAGVNTDLCDPGACAREAAKMGWDSGNDQMLVGYAAWRWEHGEEAGAINMMLEHGIDLTAAYRIIAAGRALAERFP